MSGMAGKEDGNKRGARDKRQILLMSVAWWRKWRTLHSPTCPAGICWTQLLDFVCVTRAKLAYLVWEESGGVQWSPPEYGIIWWSLWIPTMLFRWIPLDSVRLLRVLMLT